MGIVCLRASKKTGKWAEQSEENLGLTIQRAQDEIESKATEERKSGKWCSMNRLEVPSDQDDGTKCEREMCSDTADEEACPKFDGQQSAWSVRMTNRRGSCNILAMADSSPRSTA